MSMLDLFDSARRVSVPIVAIRTADQAMTAKLLSDRAKAAHPYVRWDAVRGLGGVNTAGTKALAAAGIKVAPDGVSEETIGFVEAMVACQGLPELTVVLAHNAHRQLASSEPAATAAAIQAVSNLRDTYKLNHRMLVLLAPFLILPSELEHDAVVLDHALPTKDELATIVTKLHASTQLKVPGKMEMGKAVEALTGLSAFAAEQVTSMSLTQQGLDLDALWERKRVTIEQTRGLKVYRGKERFSDIVGLASVKARLKQRLGGRRAIGVICFIDEIDKVLANVEHDTSGVRMDQLRTLLADMEDHEWEGILLAGFPGGGKSLIAKALGNEAEVPTISLDLGAMEGSLVGESEARLRHAMAVVKAVGNGNAFFVATSNNATVMRPELQRRFTGGFFFFDLLTPEERKAAWAFYLQKYDLKAQKLPEDSGWTAAEIRNCAREAWNCNITLQEASKFIVPVARARADEFESMRRYAHARYLDASKPGVYQYDKAPMAEHVRAIDLPLAPGSKVAN